MAASSATDALLSVLSPFTNASGYIGDRFADARRTAAIKSASKAAKLLKAEGIVKGDVPPKILLPWLDGASLEQDDALQDAWAGLLARAVKSSDAVNVSYIETLKRLGKREAELLAFFATDTSPDFTLKYYGLTDVETFSSENPLFGNTVKAVDDAEEQLKLPEVMDRLGIQSNRQIICYAIDDMGLPRTTKFFDENEHAVSNLEHLGLAKIGSTRFKGKSRSYFVMWFELTKYGFDMLWACQGRITGGWKDLVQRAEKTKQGAEPSREGSRAGGGKQE